MHEVEDALGLLSNLIRGRELLLCEPRLLLDSREGDTLIGVFRDHLSKEVLEFGRGFRESEGLPDGRHVVTLS